MKSDRKVVRFDYSKYQSSQARDYETLKEFEYWGFHKKNGRIHIDTKWYKKACELSRNAVISCMQIAKQSINGEYLNIDESIFFDMSRNSSRIFLN